ncbi:MAG: haloacid dehalogenase [Anaerolineales bacterium]|nr:haloacid dehalogenase [Anaerolineales bacterium]
MHKLEAIADRIRHSFDARNAARERALTQARTLTRHCANAIRAVHRNDTPLALEHLEQAAVLVDALQSDLVDYPDLYFAGYTQDALKEYAEANIVYALTTNDHLPPPEDLRIEFSTYLKGLAETVGELRRRCLDILRQGNPQEAEHLLEHMDDIYSVLITMDYPEAITGGLRHWTDMARGVIERTRGDITYSLQQKQLEANLLHLEKELDNHKVANNEAN